MSRLPLCFLCVLITSTSNILSGIDCAIGVIRGTRGRVRGVRTTGEKPKIEGEGEELGEAEEEEEEADEVTMMDVIAEAGRFLEEFVSCIFPSTCCFCSVCLSVCVG